MPTGLPNLMDLQIFARGRPRSDRQREINDQVVSFDDHLVVFQRTAPIQTPRSSLQHGSPRFLVRSGDCKKFPRPVQFRLAFFSTAFAVFNSVRLFFPAVLAVEKNFWWMSPSVSRFSSDVTPLPNVLTDFFFPSCGFSFGLSRCHKVCRAEKSVRGLSFSFVATFN